MFYRLIVCCIAFYAIYVSTNGQCNLQLEFSGNTLNINSLPHNLRPKPIYKSTLKAEKYVHQLMHFLQKKGDILPNLDTFFVKNDTFFAHIFIGENIVVNKVIVNGLDTLKCKQPTWLRKIQKQKENNLSALLKYNQQISNYLWDNGYPYATSAIKALQTDSSGSCAIIETTGNHYVTLDSILLIGTAKLHKSFLTGYLGFKRKGAYSEAKVQNVSSAFSHLPFLTLTQSPAVAFSEDKAALYIYANKQKINKFDAFIGIVPSDNTTSKVLITGSLLLDLHNICTIGENIRLNWQSIQRASQTLDIFTSFPCLFYSSFGVDGAFLLDKRDSSALDLNATAAVRYYLQKTNYLRGFYEYKHSRLLSTDYQDVISLSVEDRDFDANIYGLEFFMQNLDNIFNPRKGYVFSVSASLGKRQIRKNLHLPDSLYNSLALSAIQSCVKAGVSFYFPIKQRWVWYLGSKMGYLYSPQLLHNELFRIGGFATLRGFDEQSIYANLYLTLTNEIRFLFLRDSYLQLFFDAGWFEQRLSSTYVSGFPFGFGAGISFSTKAGAFAFSYALGKHPQNPFKIGSGRLTFGYVAVF